MSYQLSWLDKAKKLPQEILSRLDLKVFKSKTASDIRQPSYRALIVGKGAEFFTSTLNSYIDQSGWKIFISNGSEDSTHFEPQNNIIYLKGQSAMHLSLFPQKTFDLIVFLWVPEPPQDIFSLLTNIRYLLKTNGQFSIVTYLDGSPELPLSILKKIIKGHKDWSLKMYKSTLPASASEFRKMLEKAKLGDARIWKDSIACDYPSPDDVYNDIFILEEGLFADAVPSEYISIIKREFIRELGTLSFPLKVTYDFVGVSGIVKKNL
ncbi:MAG: hypothetical protein V1709_10740 [Planctomycetota bacterium]